MEYDRADYQRLYNDPEESTWSDLSTGQRICLAILFAMVMATGLIEHEAVSVMQDKAFDEKRSVLCHRYNAEGQELRASIVLETYIKGAPKPHECHYREKT